MRSSGARKYSGIFSFPAPFRSPLKSPNVLRNSCTTRKFLLARKLRKGVVKRLECYRFSPFKARELLERDRTRLTKVSQEDATHVTVSEASYRKVKIGNVNRG